MGTNAEWSEMSDDIKKAVAEEVARQLAELKAKEASPAINDLKRQLEAKERFSNIRRDFTLEMQIHFFLKDLKTWD